MKHVPGLAQLVLPVVDLACQTEQFQVIVQEEGALGLVAPQGILASGQAPLQIAQVAGQQRLVPEHMKLASDGVDAFKGFNRQLGMLAGQRAVGFALHCQQGQGVCCPDRHAALRGDLLDQLLDLCVEALSLLAAEAQHPLQYNQFIALGAGER